MCNFYHKEFDEEKGGENLRDENLKRHKSRRFQINAPL
jgi:hypothetical protein